MVSVLQETQHMGVIFPGSLKCGALLHLHFLFFTSIIVSVLHDAQHIGVVSFGSLKPGFALPQLHIVLARFIFSLCSLHLIGQFRFNP